MSQIQQDTFDDEDKIVMKKANKILSICKSDQNSKNKIFIQYVKYIFSNDFTKFNFT